MPTAATHITNPKIATLEPTWRRYRGLSVLFDNPGAHIQPGVAALADMAVDDAEGERLYDELAGVLADVDPGEMRDRYGFCPLPRRTYHVTVCDGPNERDLVHISPPNRTTVAAVIDELPDSLDRVPDALGFLVGGRLQAAVRAHPVALAPSDIAIWGQVLAARLEPADPAARAAFERVARARVDLADEIRAHLRLRTQVWRPHVSLGYFANRRAANSAATAVLGRWNEALAARPRPAVTFSSAAVYGFTDMVSFFRLGA